MLLTINLNKNLFEHRILELFAMLINRSKMSVIFFKEKSFIIIITKN